MKLAREFRYPLIIIATGAAFWGKFWLRGGIPYSPFSDTIAMGAGLNALAHRTILQEHRWPLWDPSANAGQPAHANPCTDYLFPLNWPYWMLPLDRGPGIVVALQALLAGLSMYVCMRRWLDDPKAALCCAFAYMFSYRFMAMADAGWLGPMSMVGLTPLLFWSTDRVVERPDKARVAAFALISALCLVQESMQTAYYAALGAAVFVLWRTRPLDLRERTRIAGALAAGGGLAVLLAAPVLLPRAQFTALSTRTLRDYHFFLDKTPGWKDLITILDPMDGGGARPEYWENNFYFGLWAYPLALWALLKRRKKSALLAAALAVLMLLCFDSPPLRLLYRFLPGFSLFRRPTRLLQLAQFAWVCLAGIGADSLLTGPWKRKAAWAAAMLCALPVLDAGWRMLPRLKTLPVAQAFPRPAFAEWLRRSTDNGRLVEIGRSPFSYGTAAYYGIDMVNGYSPLNLRHYQEYLSLLQTGDATRLIGAPSTWTDIRSIAKPEMLRGLDARVIATGLPIPLDSLGYERIGLFYADSFQMYRDIVHLPVYLWRDTRPLGPAFLAASLISARDEKESLALVAASESPRKAVVLGWNPVSDPKLDFSGGAARMTRRGYNEYEYQIDSRGTNLLILSQIWYPGWRAFLEGRPVPLYRVNHALIGCVVGSGRHSLRLEMTSPPLRIGLGLSAAALALIGMMLSANRVRKERP